MGNAMKWMLILGLGLLSACASQDFRCDGRLRAINAAKAVAVLGSGQRSVP